METNMIAKIERSKRGDWFVSVGLPMCNLPYRVQHFATFGVMVVRTRAEARAIARDKGHMLWAEAEARRDRFGRY
jgi:hypothetical protein